MVQTFPSIVSSSDNGIHSVAGPIQMEYKKLEIFQKQIYTSD